MIKGKDIVILDSTGSAVIAAARSCEINVTADTLEVASPNSGAYKAYIAGRKGWTVSINHLVVSMARFAPMVGTSLTIKLDIKASNGLPFNGFVNNVSVESGSYTGTPSIIYWDKTRNIFVGYVTPQSGMQLYFSSWTGSEAYSSPSAFSVFNYNNNSYTWLSNTLTKERLSGNVIVTNWKPVATVGNLANGVFTFLGNGALEPDSLLT